ncbi:MAG: IS1634 family transposase [Desulfovermiculus sp.]|nr:IS1634 family transposase [Desulfovermiculus sp.]
MTDNVLQGVETQGITFAPILKHFFHLCRIEEIIDQSVNMDPRRKILTHGQASVAMITAILFQVMQLYRICEFADKTTVLSVLFPDIKPEEYFDDRLADTLDALFQYGLGDLETQITKHMIETFGIQNNTCHNDTTTGSTYGNCANNKTDESITIDFGHSKKHRKDLKQFVWSLSVSKDSAFPLFQEAYSGNTADVSTYVKQWQNLIDLLGDTDFLYVTDSKNVCKENMAFIHDNHGFFIAPVPMYEMYKRVFHQALKYHDCETLLPYKDQINRAFEVPFTYTYDKKDYTFRFIILFDQGLFAAKKANLITRLDKTVEAFTELDSKINRYRLKTYESIDQACADILKKQKTSDYFCYTIINDPVVTYKNKHRGRTPKNKEPEKVAVFTDHFRIELRLNEDAVEEFIATCGYYPLITNNSELSLNDAMLAHKGQYKSEAINRRAKSELKLEPIYLHTPERIQAILFLFKIALQMTVLIERTARKNIDKRNRGLDGFMPNRKDVRNPTAGYLLKEFEYMVSGRVELPTGERRYFVSQLNPLQKDILSILGIPEHCYSYEYIFGPPPL